MQELIRVPIEISLIMFAAVCCTASIIALLSIGVEIAEKYSQIRRSKKRKIELRKATEENIRLTHAVKRQYFCLECRLHCRALSSGAPCRCLFNTDMQAIWQPVGGPESKQENGEDN